MANKKESSSGPDSAENTRHSPVGKRDFDPWDTFTSIANTGISMPLLFTPHMVDLGNELVRIITGQSDLSPRKDDHRFDDPTWQLNPVYKASMQTYLAWCGSITELVSNSTLDDHSKKKARTAISYLAKSFSPSHSDSNIRAMRRAFETRGASLVHGLRMMSKDVLKHSGVPGHALNDEYVLGKNLATTKGAVVYQSDILELIQYQPTRKKNYQTPLLMVPSPINRFYLCDLTKDNSLVKYLLQQGFRVFIVSWRNPKWEHKDWALNDYINSILECTKVVSNISQQQEINLFGFSAGGLFSALATNIIGRRREFPSIKSTTFAVTNFDTHAESQVGVMINDQIIDASKTISGLYGVMSGEEMARIFAWMRPNNLLWNAWVSNYFLSEEVPTPDILHWNNDVTRIPAGLHHDFLELYRSNPLLEPNKLSVCSKKIDLSKIKCDSYLLAGATDHITPWEACYQSSLKLGGDKEFVLVNRGHTRSIISPIGSEGIRYYTLKEITDNPEDWLSEANQRNGSWWPHWKKWLSERSGDEIDTAKTLGSEAYPAICAAPGTFVLEKTL